MSYVSCGTANIYYEEYGKGEALLLLHGNSEDMKYFRNNVGYFSQRYRVILIDTRGHGKSQIGKEPLDFTTLACDVFQVLDSLRIKKANVLGFSDGGNTALHMALIDESRLKKLVLCGANLYPKGMKAGTRLWIDITYLLAAKIRKDIEKQHIFNLMRNQPVLDEKMLHNINIPVLVIAGENDMIKADHTIGIARNIKNSALKIIKDGDHFVMRKRANECNRLVDKFLSANTS